MTSEIKRRFTDTEMQTARETDLPELLTHLGYQVKRIGRYYTTAEMDSLRIKDRRTWFRYSQGIGGDAITFLQHFCNQSFPEADCKAVTGLSAGSFVNVADVGGTWVQGISRLVTTVYGKPAIPTLPKTGY